MARNELNVSEKITGLAILIPIAMWFTYNSFKPLVRKNSIFSAKKEMEYCKKKIVLDLDGDNKYETLAASYDLNEDGKIDVIGLYKIKYVKNRKIVTYENAYGVVIDKNEDGTPDYVLIDNDNNNTLETKLRWNEIKVLHQQRYKSIKERENMI